MGRLQRKKTTPKKKKIESEEGAIVEEGQGGEKATSLLSGSSGDKKKSLPSQQKKSVNEDSMKFQPDGHIAKALQFLREVKVELKKVTWPTRAQTIGSTAVVIVLVMIISFFLGLVDVGLSAIVTFVLH